MCRTLTAAGICVYYLIYLRQIDVQQDIFLLSIRTFILILAFVLKL